jgi:hypothetical protein
LETRLDKQKGIVNQFQNDPRYENAVNKAAILRNID